MVTCLGRAVSPYIELYVVVFGFCFNFILYSSWPGSEPSQAWGRRFGRRLRCCKFFFIKLSNRVARKERRLSPTTPLSTQRVGHDNVGQGPK